MSLLNANKAISAPDVRFKRTPSTRYNGSSPYRVASAVFDPSGNTAQRATGAHGLGVYIPDNAIITKAWYDVITTFTSADDSATIALHVQSAGDIQAAVAISTGTPYDAGLHASLLGFPNLGADAAHDSAAEVGALYMGVSLKMTAERELVATVATQALTAGKLVLYVEYVLGD